MKEGRQEGSKGKGNKGKEKEKKKNYPCLLILEQ